MVEVLVVVATVAAASSVVALVAFFHWVSLFLKYSTPLAVTFVTDILNPFCELSFTSKYPEVIWL
jgi:hypothetical protein